MNICLVNTTQFWGGGEKWFYQNAVFLSQNGFNVFALANCNGALWHKLKTHSHITLKHLEVKNLSFLNPNKKSDLKKFFIRNKIETLLLNASAEVKLCAPVAKKAGLKNIIYRRGSAIEVKGSALNKSLFGNVVTQIIANSQATKNTFLINLEDSVAELKITVIPNGILVPREVPKKKAGVFTIGTLGRLEHQKGIDLAIATAERLNKSGFVYKWLVGGDGSEQQKLKHLVLEKDLEDKFEFLGKIEDIDAFFRKLDVYVHTARWEGFGFAIAEAMAYGLPVIAYNVSSNPELIKDGETGVLIEMGNTIAMADSIIEISKDENRFADFGKNGRALIQKSFSIEKQQQRLLAFLNEL